MMNQPAAVVTSQPEAAPPPYHYPGSTVNNACSRCGTDISNAITESRFNSRAFCWASILSPFCLFWLPFTGNWCKSSHTTCPHCNHVLPRGSTYDSRGTSDDCCIICCIDCGGGHHHHHHGHTAGDDDCCDCDCCGAGGDGGCTGADCAGCADCGADCAECDFDCC